MRDIGGGEAAVVGAGIGGLAAGIALQQAGWSVRVYEQAEEMKPLGAGLSVWPNGVHALRSLGVGSVADRAPRTGGALRRANGSELAGLDPNVLAERYGAPLVGMHRADLHEALLEGLGRDRLRLGATVSGLGEGCLEFEDGSSESADLIVGADGIDSVVRGAIVGDGEADDSGIVAYRGVAEWSGEIPAGEWWGSGVIAGLLPLLRGRVYWYLALRGDGRTGELEDRLGAFAPPMREIVNATPEDAVLFHRLRDRAPVKKWGAGNAVLLGDAAHPMLPFLGQGACAALEDAVALGAAVGRRGDIPQAIADYEAARHERTAALVRDSRRAGKVALAGSAPVRRLRDFLAAHVPQSARLRQLDGAVGN